MAGSAQIATKTNTVDILGIPVSAVTMDDVVDLADNHITCGKQLLLGVLNAAKLVNARRDRRLRESLLEADVIVADGMPIVWLSRLVGKSLPERIAGIDIMYRLLKLADENNYSVYLLGAAPAVVAKAARQIRNDYPGLRVAGFRDGFFEPAEEKDVAENIRQSGADILFVAISSPKKENFLRKWREVMNVAVCHGVGGSFDIVAGVTKRAPAWMQKCSLEWLFRVIQEPRRMWKRYLVTNTIFIKLSIAAVIRAHLGGAKSAALVFKPAEDSHKDRL